MDCHNYSKIILGQDYNREKFLNNLGNKAGSGRNGKKTLASRINSKLGHYFIILDKLTTVFARAYSYDMNFLEIGTDEDHVHFLIQSMPRLSPSQIDKTIKSITALEIFNKCPELKKILWGDGYFVSTVGKHGNRQIEEYVKKQGKAYTQLHQEKREIF